MADAVAQVAAPSSPSSVSATPSAWGEVYGRYHLLERIGKGGMAEVFRAIAGGAEGWTRQFVVKRIRPEKSQSREFIRMFCQEARLCALLHHPNIVQVYDFGQIDGSYFLAMEYLRGKDLSTVLRAVRAAKEALSPGLAAFIAQQAASGLHHAHTLVDGNGQLVRIVHRDVTPSNIMLLRSGGVKILDFGIAKDVGQEEAEIVETEAGQVKGKLAYLAPEQVRNLPLDGRADLFALGVVLWEMLTGQRLFSADSEFQTMRNVLTQPVPLPSSVRPGVSPALDAIVARALERDRVRRYLTAADMAADLEQVVHSERFLGQAIPELIQKLFGDDVSLTPTPMPGSLSPVSGLAAVSRSPSSSSERRIPLGLGPTGEVEEVSMRIIESEVLTPEPTLVVFGLRSNRARVLVALVALVVAGAGLMTWRSAGGSAAATVSSPVVVAAPPMPIATPPAPEPEPAAVEPPATAVAPAASKALTRAAARPRPARKTAAHASPSALTFNPFQ